MIDAGGMDDYFRVEGSSGNGDGDGDGDVDRERLQYSAGEVRRLVSESEVQSVYISSNSSQRYEERESDLIYKFVFISFFPSSFPPCKR